MENVQTMLKMPNFKEKPNKEILTILLGNREVAPMVAKYLTRSMELREFLTENHKQHM